MRSKEGKKRVEEKNRNPFTLWEALKITNASSSRDYIKKKGLFN